MLIFTNYLPDGIAKGKMAPSKRNSIYKAACMLIKELTLGAVINFTDDRTIHLENRLCGSVFATQFQNLTADEKKSLQKVAAVYQERCSYKSGSSSAGQLRVPRDVQAVLMGLEYGTEDLRVAGYLHLSLEDLPDIFDKVDKGQSFSKAAASLTLAR